MLSRGATRLLTLIQKFLTRYGKFFASQTRIAAWLKTTARTVRRWTAELIQASLIATKRRSQNTLVYSLLPVKVSAQVSAQVSGQVSGHYKEDLNTYNNGNNVVARKPPRRAQTPMEAILEKYANG